MTNAAAWPEELFDESGRRGRIALVGADGRRHHLDTARWHEVVSTPDRQVLSRVDGPVLDVGCGPGRHVGALADRGHDVLGIDTSSAAVRNASRRGAAVLLRSVFGSVPRATEWGTILLLDGNIGIGGDPGSLLRRCATLLRPGGRVLVETEPPGAVSRSGPVRVEPPVSELPLGPTDRRPAAWFPWAVVSASQVWGLALAAGFEVAELWTIGGRWFAELIAADVGADDPASERRDPPCGPSAA